MDDDATVDAQLRRYQEGVAREVDEFVRQQREYELAQMNEYYSTPAQSQLLFAAQGEH